VLGVCSVIDGKVRDNSGKVIGKKTAEGSVKLNDGTVLDDVRISTTIEYKPAPPI
jgi:hypothetical protein